MQNQTQQTQTQPSIHPLLRGRQSRYAIDPERSVSAPDLAALFEAVRWSMSSYNAQPWRYIVGVRDRDDGIWQQVFDTLLEGNQAWARNAPVLALGLAEHNFEYNGQPNKAALHDLGAASAALTFEATARGLNVHQIIGLDPVRAREIFGLDSSLEPFTALAIGYPGSPDVVEATYAQRDKRQRERKSLQDIILRGAID